MPKLVPVTWPASVLSAEDWEAYENNYMQYKEEFETEITEEDLEEMEVLDREYRMRLEEDDDPEFPF